MSWVILILGMWSTAEGLFALTFPGLARRLAQLMLGKAGAWVAEQSDSTLRKIAAIEAVFGFWMLALWYFTR